MLLNLYYKFPSPNQHCSFHNPCVSNFAYKYRLLTLLYSPSHIPSTQIGDALKGGLKILS